MLGAPQLEVGDELFYRAFAALGSCRTGNGVIPWTAIRDYCNEYDIQGELREDMFFLVHRLDDTYVEFNNKEKEKANASSQDIQKSKPGVKRPRK